jgi:diguanylate cyclase (GGDEF)-like protein/PAS domain S-box-containing protein
VTTTARPAHDLMAPTEEYERLQALVEGLPVGIYRSTPTGQILAANAALVRLLGYSTTADLLGLDAADLYMDQSDRRRWKDQMDRDGLVRAFDFRIRRPNGEIIWVRDTARAIRDDGGRVLYYEGILEDITERKRIREALRESEQRSQGIFESAPIGIAIISPEGRFIKANQALCDMLGYTSEELSALTITDVTHPDDAERERQLLARLARRERALYELDKRYLRKRGEAFWAHLTARMVRDETGEPLYWLGMVEDIDEQRQAQDALREANERLIQSLAELKQRTMRVALLTEMTDLLQSSRSLDEAYAILEGRLPELFSADAGAVYLQSASRKALEAVSAWGMQEQERLFAPDDCWAMRRGHRHLARRSGPFCPHLAALQPAWSFCIPMTAQGETLGVFTLASASHVHETDEEEKGKDDPERLFAATVAEHVALALANLRLRESLKSQSIRDPLTGLFNRRYMEETLERELRRAERRKAPIGIVMFDIDHFKRFNDTHGHLAGDALLRALGEFLQANFRGEDIVCRYGGEEFVLILPEAPLEATVRRADTLRERVKVLHVPYRGALLGGVTLSLGVAEFPGHGSTAEAMLRAADAALYQAKSSGRDHVISYSTG